MNSKQHTVIIPVHVFDDNVKAMLDNAIASVPTDVCNIVLSVGNDIMDNFTTYGENGAIVVGNDKTDFCSMVNHAVESAVDTEFFSILEFDDEYFHLKYKSEDKDVVGPSVLFANFDKYLEVHNDVDVFMPLVAVHASRGKRMFMQYANESPWAASFVGEGELGFIPSDMEDELFGYNMTGCIFRTSSFKEVGMLKTNIKFTFWFEYLLRAIKKGQQFFVIPKIGYVHYVQRPGSLFEDCTKSMDDKEIQFWIDTAKIESDFNEQRDVEYVAA